MLAALTAAYRVDLPDDTQEVWYSSALERCPLEDAGEVLARIIATEEFFPTPAVWHRVRRELLRARQIAAAPSGELPAPDGPPPDPKSRAALVAALKAALAFDPAHDHKRGVDACPTCGNPGQAQARIDATLAEHGVTL